MTGVPKYDLIQQKTMKFIHFSFFILFRPTTSPWGHFKGTWQLPEKITKNRANELHAPPVGGSRWAKPVRILT